MDAESVDVELFFKKHASLVAKMKRMEMRDMNQDVVDSKSAIIEPLIKSWEATSGTEGDDDISEFAVLLKWAKSFCDGAKTELKIKTQEEAVEAARKASMDAQTRHQTSQRLVSETE